ncbi:MAG: zinc ribbon domain-containing protein [Lachnospiraceae bacterium]|nr:zinc ribbon domain-containing protein [Lachnospiraceae bacterium]
MYYVPDGTVKCGFYECEECGERFLSLHTESAIPCPTCGEEPDMELGPDEEIPEAAETAKLLQIVEGEEVEKMDALLSLAITGGDYEWI